MRLFRIIKRMAFFPLRNINSWFAIRYQIALLGSLGMAIIYGLKVNLSVAIVSMVNHTAIRYNGVKFPDSNLAMAANECPGSDVSESLEDGPFAWPSTLQGTMLSSYFWGYIIAQIPGGRIAELYSAKWLMFFAVFVNIVCTVLTPLAAKLHFSAMMLMRVLEGIGGGVTFPAMHVMLAHWTTINDRSVMSNMVYAGTALGTVISMLGTGYLASVFSWEAVFYVMGILSGVWLFLWVFLVTDRPEDHKKISEDEKKYIISSVKVSHPNQTMPPVPWTKVITNPPFLAILIAHTCNNWGWYMILMELPLYMKTVLKFKIKENALATSLPFLCMWIFSMILSHTLDSLRRKNSINTTQARKLATSFGSAIPMVCFMIIPYIGCDRDIAVVLMTIAITGAGGMYSGYLVNHIDIASNYAGTLIALTNTVATIPGIIVPLFVGKLTQTDPTSHSWTIIFWTTVVLYSIELLVYLTFASGEEQSFNMYSTPLLITQKIENYESTIDNADVSKEESVTNVTE